MMSESFEPNSRFDTFGEDLRLSLEETAGASSNNIQNPATLNDTSPTPSTGSAPRSQTQFSNVGSTVERQQLCLDRTRSHGMPETVLSSAMCGSSLTHLVNAQSKISIDSLKTWGVSAYKCTRQAISERLGKTSRTIDAEMDQNVTSLREEHCRYEQLLTLARSLLAHFHQVQQAQQSLGSCMAEFANHEPDLREEYLKNAETQNVIANNGRSLESALTFFISSLETLCHKTIEDTMLTVRNFETARLEYDAYRCDYETLQQSPTRGSDHQARLMDAELALQQHKQRYDQLRDDVQVKMRFLHENKIKVMKKQLLLLHNATSAYFAGNQRSLETSLQQFNLKPVTSSSNQPTSWLEA